MTTGWLLIICAPVNEFMDAVTTLNVLLVSVSLVILCIIILVIFIISYKFTKPIRSTVSALKNIADEVTKFKI